MKFLLVWIVGLVQKKLLYHEEAWLNGKDSSNFNQTYHIRALKMKFLLVEIVKSSNYKVFTAWIRINRDSGFGHRMVNKIFPRILLEIRRHSFGIWLFCKISYRSIELQKFSIQKCNFNSDQTFLIPFCLHQQILQRFFFFSSKYRVLMKFHAF